MTEVVEALSRRSTNFASSSAFPAKPSMSSAKRRLVIVLLPVLTEPSSSKASIVIVCRNMLKRVGESGHYCRTPTVVQNQSHMLPSKRTTLVAL